MNEQEGTYGHDAHIEGYGDASLAEEGVRQADADPNCVKCGGKGVVTFPPPHSGPCICTLGFSEWTAASASQQERFKWVANKRADDAEAQVDELRNAIAFHRQEVYRYGRLGLDVDGTPQIVSADNELWQVGGLESPDWTWKSRAQRAERRADVTKVALQEAQHLLQTAHCSSFETSVKRSWGQRRRCFYERARVALGEKL